MPSLDYLQAVEFLDSLLVKRTRHLSLKRTAHLLNLVDNPQQGLKVFHVGGTSGKGSVVTFIAEIMQAAGFRVGVNISPYLQVPIERIRVNELYISAEELAELTSRVKPLAEAMLEEGRYGRLRYLELWMALAFLYFRQQKVDFAVVEVGAGGRYDCTNVVHPVVAVIVTVDFDHQDLLGETIREIAYHKAGIIKAGVPVVTAESKRDALSVIEQECLAQGSELLRIGHDIKVEVKKLDCTGAEFDYLGTKTYHNLRLRLLGRHQITNAATAVAAVEASEALHGFKIPEQAIRSGLEAATLPGRLEVVQDSPRVILDGAHNAQKIRSLVKSLQKLFDWDRMILVVGMLQTKDSSTILRELATLGDLLVATAPDVVGKKSLDPDLLALRARSEGMEVVVQPDPHSAIEYALSVASADDLVCVTGSLYLVGKIRGFWVPPEQILTSRTSQVPHVVR